MADNAIDNDNGTAIPPTPLTQYATQKAAAQYTQQLTSPSISIGSTGGLIQGGLVPGSLSGTNYTITTTGTGPLWVKEYEVSRIVKRAKNGYFFVITVDATDEVFYRVWQGGWFPYLVAKMFNRFGTDIDGNRGSWNTVTKRSHLPATLGATYEKIDEVIKEDIESEDHEYYVKELLGTKPENLKMIGSLEKLAEGDVDEDTSGVSSSASGPWVASSTVAPPAGAMTAQPGNMIIFSPDVAPGDLTQVVADCVQEAGEEFTKALTKTAIAP